MSTESSTQQRPWEVVAPWPETPDLTAIRAHYAAMAWAHMLTYRRDMSAATHLDPEALKAGVALATARHGDPMFAAFSAAALTGGHTITETSHMLADADITEETLYDWLRAAGIAPAEIAPAS